MSCIPEGLLTLASARAQLRIIGLSTGSPVFDDDLAQEALLHAVKAFARSASVNNPQAFFKKIVRNTLYDHWRRTRALITVDIPYGHEPIANCYLDDSIDRQRLLDRIY